MSHLSRPFIKSTKTSCIRLLWSRPME